LENFADRLIEVIQQKGSPIVVGLDPQLQYIPTEIKDQAFRRYGQGSKGASLALLEFNRRILDIVSPYTGIVKLQVAFYELLGPPGMDTYQKTLRYAQKKGLLTIGDIKRGDVEHTALAYAQAHLGEVEVEDTRLKGYDCDAVTLNPYLGQDSIAPFLRVAEERDKGLFILVKTTNPSSKDFQDMATSSGERLFEKVAKKVAQWGKGLMGRHGYSSVGAVVGAQYPNVARRLRRLMPRAFFLVPGYGAQGARAEELDDYFNADGYGAIIASSRAITFAYLYPPWKGRAMDWEEAVRQAVQKMHSEVAGAAERAKKIRGQRTGDKG
jgi:orotidine-5'-phosphate decarboxylase